MVEAISMETTGRKAGDGDLICLDVGPVVREEGEREMKGWLVNVGWFVGGLLLVTEEESSQV